MKVLIASDHAGFELKEKIIAHFKKSFEIVDLGPTSQERCDYPDYVDKLVQAGRGDKTVMGILVCGSGQGMAMRANKYPEIRAALCWNEDSMTLARQHNDANVLCLGSRLITEEMALKLVDIFTSMPFAGGRHGDRVKKISSPLC